MDEPLIKVEGLSKKFCKNLQKSLWYGIKDLAADMLRMPTHDRLRKDEFWVLQDINFTVNRGECLGLIGSNGAGKTTLLRILSGIIPPDRGRVEVEGRLSSIIELGAGLNPLLTGRENIQHKAYILGYSAAELRKRFDEIVEFAELADFLDTPLMYYSSGMKVKLGFSVATHLQSDIIILDEVLAVGDAGYRVKSFNKISSLMKEAAVILVSHRMSDISLVCNKIAVLHEGSMTHFGSDISAGISAYNQLFMAAQRPAVQVQNGIKLNEIRINSMPQSHTPTIRYGGTLNFEFTCSFEYAASLQYYVDIRIRDAAGTLVASYNSQYHGATFDAKQPHKHSFGFPNLRLADNTYTIALIIGTIDDGATQLLGRFLDVAAFTIKGLNLAAPTPYFLETL